MGIVGHQKILKFLLKSMYNNTLSHAYLFSGPRHIGKSTVAQYFVINLICSENKNRGQALHGGQACGRCVNCKQVLKRIHPDVYWISESSKKIGIDSIRQIIAALSLKPFASNIKVAIIEQADNLTIQAANSFLKFLEEAPKNTIIILISSSLYKLAITLRSRCQILRFSSPSEQEIISFLKREFNLNAEIIKKILYFSISRPGIAIEFARNPDLLDKYESILNEFISLLLSEKFDSRIKLINMLLNSDFSDLYKLLILSRALFLAKLENYPAEHYFNKDLKALSNKYTKERLINFTDQILRTQILIGNNVNKKLAIENLFIDI